MTDSPSLTELLEVQKHFALPSTALVEKDWHVIRAMQAVSRVDAAPFRLVFAGGTCLARAHKLVQRMSEDVDFKVVPNETTPRSASKLRQQLGALRDRITASLQEAGFPVEPGTATAIRSRDANRYTIYQLTATPSGSADSHLRPTLQVELSYADLRLPSIDLPVSSFVSEAYGRPPEIRAMACASVTETAAEKLVSLTRRTAMELAGKGRASDPTLLRHIYDLHTIRDHTDQATAVALAREIAIADAEEFANQHPAYRADIAAETHKALAHLRNDPEVRARYERFVAAMVYGERSDFIDAIMTMTHLAEEAWPRR
ncbi:MAG: nucleotidyl transferase AbiEii/AbiGii toxin family protein [Aquabacterium sp.]|uniref:nucleotidyl transferase AbiEii/AbiGii toxin family protein n=1 Tax=Aquabacterium sp. TaxID=1872578 RepID=UPI003BAEE0C7